MAIAIDDRLLEVRMQRRFLCGEKSRPEQNAFRAHRKRRRQSAAIGDPAGTKHRQGFQGFDHHGNQRQRCHPSDMAARFRTLRHQNIGAGFGSPQRFGHFAGHVHDLAAHVVGAPIIIG